MTESLLRIDGVGVDFGGLRALTDVTFDLAPGATLGIVGPNGAGKTTLLNVISGLTRSTAGAVVMNPGIDITRRPAYHRARLGIGRTFQSSRLFAGLTALEQIMTGGFASARNSLGSSLLRTPRMLRTEWKLRDDASRLMEELHIADLAHAEIDMLPSATRRLVDLARALINRPSVLLVDEIGAGCTLDEKVMIESTLRARNEKGTAIIVIEHDLDFVRAIAKDVVVLVEGRILAEGPTEEILARADVLEAYTGGSDHGG